MKRSQRFRFGRTNDGRDFILEGNGGHALGDVYRNFEVCRLFMCFQNIYRILPFLQFSCSIRGVSSVLPVSSVCEAHAKHVVCDVW